jgi:hypothetical protein
MKNQLLTGMIGQKKTDLGASVSGVHEQIEFIFEGHPKIKETGIKLFGFRQFRGYNACIQFHSDSFMTTKLGTVVMQTL